MTAHSDFKKLVRDRMSRTGENYTTARAALELDRDAARAQHERLLRPHFADEDFPGFNFTDAHLTDGRMVGGHIAERRLLRIPARRRARFAVLLELLGRFTPGETYSETQVNSLLRPVHDDVAYLRRELVDYRLLERDGQGTYWVTATPPVRDVNEAQECGDWEKIWLPEFLGSRPEPSH